MGISSAGNFHEGYETITNKSKKNSKHLIHFFPVIYKPGGGKRYFTSVLQELFIGTFYRCEYVLVDTLNLHVDRKEKKGRRERHNRQNSRFLTVFIVFSKCFSICYFLFI